MNFKNSKKVIIAAAISTSVLFASNQAYAAAPVAVEGKEILDSDDKKVLDNVSEITTENKQINAITESEESITNKSDIDLPEEKIDSKDKTNQITNYRVSEISTDDEVEKKPDDIGVFEETSDGEIGPLADETDDSEIPPLTDETYDSEIPPLTDEVDDSEIPPLAEDPLDQVDPIDDIEPIPEEEDEISGKGTIELKTQLIGIDNNKFDIESLPEEVEVVFTYNGKEQTKTINREELYGLVELTNFEFKNEEDLKNKLKGDLYISDGEKLEVTFIDLPNSIEVDKNNRNLARVPLKIQQLYNPKLEVEFQDPDGQPYENNQQVGIFIKWGDGEEEYESTLISNDGLDENKLSNGLGLVFDNDNYLDERTKTPTIIVRDINSGDQVLSKDTKTFVYNAKTYSIKDLKIDPVNGAKISYSAEPTSEKVVDGGRRVEEVPFDIERVENENLPEGEVRITREGQNGKRVYQQFQATLDGKDYGKPTEVEIIEEYEEPVNEIYQVGTGKLDTSNNKETKEIPYSTITIEDKYLPSTYREVERNGENGSKTVVTTSQSLNGKPYGEDVITEKIDKLPVDEIIRVGVATEDQITTDTKTYETEIPYTSKIEENPNLEAGTTNIKKAGANGKKVTTVSQQIINGKAYGEATVKEEIIQEAQEEIIEVGTKKVDSVTTEYEEDVPYKTITRENPDLEAGKTNIVQEGKTGRRKVIVSQDVINGQPSGQPKVSYEQLIPMVEEIIEVGTRVDDINTIYEYQVTKPIPFNTEYVDDPSLPAGEEKISIEGKQGLETITYEQRLVNGKADENNPATIKSRETTTEATTQIIRKGTGVIDKTVTNSVEEIPFDTQYIDDPSLPAGEEIEIRQGVNGEKTITTVQPTLNGENYGQPTVKETITKAPVDKIVRRGTTSADQVTTDTKTFTEEIPYESIEEKNPNLPFGQRKIIQEGKNGKKVTTITQQIVNGRPYGLADENVVVTEAQNEIIQIGTKWIDIENIAKTEKEIPFETIRINTSDLYEGETKLIQDGEVGIKLLDPQGKEEIIKKPINEIILVGSKKKIEWTEIENIAKKEVEIPFKTITRTTNELDEGQQEVIQEGSVGKKLVDPKGNEEVIKEPVDKIVLIGSPKIESSKEILVETSYEDIAYETSYQYDPNRYVGDDELLTKGKNGKKKMTTTTITDGQTTTTNTDEQVLEEAVNEVWIIGTKQIEPEIQPEKPELKYIELPLKTEYVTDDSLDYGVEVIIQEGQTAVYAIDENGEYILPALREEKVRIIKKGTKKPIEKINYIDEEIKVQYIDTDLLAQGREVIISQGQAGRYYIDENSNKVYVIQAMDRIILRGTAKANNNKDNDINIPEKEDDNSTPLIPIYPSEDIEIDKKPSYPSNNNENTGKDNSKQDDSSIDINKIIEDWEKLQEDFEKSNKNTKPIDKADDNKVKDNNSSNKNDREHSNTKAENNLPEEDERINAYAQKDREYTKALEKNNIAINNIRKATSSKSTNPKTGIESIGEVIGILSAASAGLFISNKKKKENE